jgi:hypothetical protein
MRAPETRWKIRNGLNLDPMNALPSDGSVRKVLPVANKVGFPKYADIFAKDANGKVYPYMPNLSSQKSVQYAANIIKKHFREHPKQNSFGIGAEDGLPRDYSKCTQALHLNLPSMIGKFNDPQGSSTTEEWMLWIQGVSAEVRKEFPDKLLTTNGYANRHSPPISIEPDPSICIMFAAIFSDTYHALNHPNSWMTTRQYNMLKRWTELYDNVYMYNYLYFNLVGNGAPPIPLARRHRLEMPLLKQLEIAGFWDEGRTVRGESGIFPHYLRAQMMWDAGLDANALAAEYFTNWYGPAAEPAFEFWDAMKRAIENSIFGGNEDHMLSLAFTPELIHQLQLHLSLAKNLAEGNDWAEPRVKADRATFNYLLAYKAMERPEFNANWTEAAKQAQRMNQVLQQAWMSAGFIGISKRLKTRKKPSAKRMAFTTGALNNAEMYT